MSVPTNTTITTITKSVLLQPGEEFVLPPNARLLSATDVNSLSSTCEIPELEELTCYLYVVAVGNNDNSDTILWDAQDFRLRGWRYNGKDLNDMRIGCVNERGDFDNNAGIALMASAAANGIFISAMRFGTHSNNDNGAHNYFVISTIPSVAKNLEMKVDTGASYIEGDTFTPAVYIKPLKYADTTDLSNVPVCPIETSSSTTLT